MTICIAAIAENNKIIAITDKMITLGGPLATRFEISENNKAIKLTDKSIALFAGNVLPANEILAIAKAKIAATTTDILDIASVMKDAYFEHWAKQLNDVALKRYSLDLATFMQKHTTLNQDFVKQINEIIANANLGVEILVAGVDAAPHLFYIGNPGTLNSLDSIGYALIGSGSQHAQLSLIESEYHSGIAASNGLYALLEAKKRAEYDPGVGQLSDIVIIDGNFNKLSEAKIGILIKEFNKFNKSSRKTKVKNAVKIYNLV